MNSSVVALISCISSSERPRKGRAGMLTLTFFLLIHCPPTWKRRFFARFARMVRPLSPNWWVAACLTFVPTANPEASAVVLMELRSWEESMRVLPPVSAARMEVFHRLPSGPGLA